MSFVLPRGTSSAAPHSAARDFVEENKVAAVAAAARRPVKAEAKSGGGAGEYLHKSEYGQVRGQGIAYPLFPSEV